MRAGQIAATAGTITLGAAMAGAAAHAVALGQSAIVAAGAIGLMPSALAQAVGTAIAARVVFGGLGEAWKQTGAAATVGGGAAVDVARQVELAQRSVRDATAHLADAQRDALAAQEAVSRARMDEAERLADLTRSLASARLSEREAINAVNQAKSRMAQSKGGDRNEVEAARLAYQRSLLTLEEVRDRVGDLSKEQAEATEKGVEGSDAVQAAVRRQEDSQRALTQATERLADAQRALADAGKSVGGAADKAKEALAALAPSAAALVLTMRALAPAWTAAGKAGQQAAFAETSGDFRRLSEIYLPLTTTWLTRMGEAFNLAMRDAVGLATTEKTARDMDATFHALAATTTGLAASIRPFVNGFLQFVHVGAQLLPGISGEVGSLAGRFERWATAARESGRMQEWMTTGWAVLKQFGEVAKNVVMSIVGIFKAGENTGTLDGLVALSASMRAWVESAEGQEKIAAVMTFLRSLFLDLAAILPAFSDNSAVLSDTISVFGAVVNLAASNLDTFAAALPYILAGMIIWKSVQTAANAASIISVPIRAAELITNWKLAASMKAHTAALTANTAAQRVGTVSTVASTVATNVADATNKRSLISMAAAKTAQIAGAAATGIATAAQWLWNAAMYANPIGLIILAVIAFIAIIVVLVKYHEEIGAWIGKAWDWIWEKIKWVWQKVQEGAAYARDYVVERFMTLINFITSLPGRVANAAKGLWNGIIESFKGMINFLIRGWNSLDFGINLRVPDWIPASMGGGKSWSIPDVIPDLPYLDVGGRVLETGMAVIHKGEDVVPAAEVARRNSGGSGSRQVVELRAAPGDAFGALVIETLRKAIGDRGGDVQFVLGNN